MKRLIAIASATAIALGASWGLQSCGPEQARLIGGQGKDHSGLPPRAYRGDGHANVVFSSNVALDCQKAGLYGLPGQTNACAIIQGERTTLIVSNPCRQVGNYAKTLCHELGHANGWRH